MENEYDYYNRIIGVKYNGTRLFSYVYNSDGLVSRYIDNANHKTYNYNYDMLGRVQRIDVSDGSNISYTYNNLNQVTGIKYGFNGTTKSSTYTYKKGGIPDLTTYPNGATKTHVLNGQVQLGETVLTTTGTNQWETDCIYYTVIDDGVSYTTNLVGDYTFNEIGRTISYTYDGSGNIATKADTKYSTTNKIEYFYDELNQLIRENDPVANKTTTYVYDNGGNILEKREYDYTTGTLGTPTKTTKFRYVSTQWKDLLTSYTGHEILYDAVGNPLKFGDITMTWERGRKLSTMTFADGSTASYKYNADGIRTQKTVNGVTTDYFLEGSTIVAQKTGNDVIWYYFDGDGTRDAIEYNGNVYYYMYNPQGDVIGLFDDDLNVVVEYTYDSWGKIISTTGSLKDTLGKANPFRYRGYYYDEESGFYYLNSRYYYPEIGRFINADGYVQTGQGILDKNMFAYCMNNPVNYGDSTGEAPFRLSRYLLTHWLFGGGRSLFFDKDSFVSKKIKNSKLMQNHINEEIQKYKDGKTNNNGAFSFEYNEPDLWLGIRGVNYELGITEETKETGFWIFKKTKTRCVVDVKVYDIYNFNIGTEKGDGIGSLLNNFGFWLHENNVGTDYYWEANYVYKTKWEY